MYDTSKPLGHVIRIIDEYTVIVDVGANALSVDDFIQIYQPRDYIYDLEGNVLSEYFCIKDELKIFCMSKSKRENHTSQPTYFIAAVRNTTSGNRKTFGGYE